MQAYNKDFINGVKCGTCNQILFISNMLFVCLQVPLEEGLNKTIQYFSRELEHQANNQYIPKPKAARMKKGRPRHN